MRAKIKNAPKAVVQAFDTFSTGYAMISVRPIDIVPYPFTLSKLYCFSFRKCRRLEAGAKHKKGRYSNVKDR